MSKQDSRLLFDIEEHQLPIVYDKRYNVAMMGLEKLHVFDVQKWGNIVRLLIEQGTITEECIVKPKEAKNSDLQLVHTKCYLRSLNCSYKVAMITEIPYVCLVPNCILQKAYLKPMRRQTGGTALGGHLALRRGWAVNVGGGFHHARRGGGAGFCAYADIALAVRLLRDAGAVKRVTIVDLDAHQGNGHERDLGREADVYILDMYNGGIYPRDRAAKRAIRRRVELRSGCADAEYLRKLRSHLPAALAEFPPELVVYNAGTDVLAGDPLGLMDISEEGVIQRDEFVFETCRRNKIPIVMLTSGGYLRKSAGVVAASIANLQRKGLIDSCPPLATI